MNSNTMPYRPNGMRGLLVIWIGQMISGVTTSAALFAQIHWISDRSEASGTALAYWESFYFAAYLLFVLFALFFIDRFPRKMMMLLYDFLLLSATAVLLALDSLELLQTWHIYLNAVIQGVGYAFRLPTYSSVISVLVPRKQYVRANGMLSLLYDTPEIFGPLFVSLFYALIGLSGFLVINLLSFLVSIGALLFVYIPSAPQTDEGDETQPNILKEALLGVQYIFKNPGLLGMQMVFFVGNIFSGIAFSFTAFYTMIALRTNGNLALADSLQSAGAWAAVVAGLLLSIIGGMKRPIRVILLSWALSSLFGLTLLGIGQFYIVWAIAMVVDAFFGPVVNVAADKFIQTKVPLELQGRVFSANDFISQLPFLFTPLLAGLLGDKVFEPLMQTSDAWTKAFGWLVGTGPGAGYGLLIFLCGLGGVLVGVVGYALPAVRNADELTPDIVIPPPVGLVRRINPLTVEEHLRKRITNPRMKAVIPKDPPPQ